METAVLDGGYAFWVDDWGSCTGLAGAHVFDLSGETNGWIMIGSGMSQLETVKTMWHEGWSWFNGCTDLVCHDNGGAAGAERPEPDAASGRRDEGEFHGWVLGAGWRVSRNASP